MCPVAWPKWVHIENFGENLKILLGPFGGGEKPSLIKNNPSPQVLRRGQRALLLSRPPKNFVGVGFWAVGKLLPPPFFLTGGWRGKAPAVA